MRVLYTQHRNLDVESPSQRLELPVDPDLEAVLMRCLEKDPARRYANARDLEEALRACRAYGRWTRRDAEAWWKLHAAALIGTHAGEDSTHRIPRADRMAS